MNNRNYPLTMIALAFILVVPIAVLLVTWLFMTAWNIVVPHASSGVIPPLNMWQAFWTVLLLNFVKVKIVKSKSE